MKQFSKQEDMDMWNFLLKEIVDPITGFIERERIKARGLTIWERFRAEYNNLRSATSLRKRYSMAGFPTPESLKFDLNSQVKLHYALGIPLHDSQQNMLLENADFDLDESSCIIRYKDRRPGGLELRSFVKRRRKTKQLDDEEVKRQKMDMARRQNYFVAEDPRNQPGTSFQDDASNQMHHTFNNPYSPNPDNQSSNEEIKKEVDFEELIPVKKEIDNGPPTEILAYDYLSSMDSLISQIDSPELEHVQSKIITAMEESPHKKIPIEKVKMMMEATLAMMGV